MCHFPFHQTSCFLVRNALKKMIGTAKHSSQILVLSSKEGLIDCEKSVSSCPSSSSSSEDDDRESRDHRRRLKYTLPEDTANACPPMLIIGHKKTREKSVVVVKGFFSDSRVAELKNLFQSAESVYEIKDRKDNLYHAHRAFRVEIALRLKYPKVYRKILGVSSSVCDAVWGGFKEKNIRRNRVLPEFEYIVYDAPTGSGRGTFIEPHVDNHSIVTGIVMLSNPDVDFEGGVNRFKGAQSDSCESSFREYKLEKGDLVLFRGELVTHWITPVTRGVREIFQWELSRI